jgi:hypothetical protein
MEAVEWFGIGTAVAIVVMLAAAFLKSWRKRKQTIPRPSQPYREWKD